MTAIAAAEDTRALAPPLVPAAEAYGRSDTPAMLVGKVLSLPDEQLDYACSKLAFDTVADPTLDRVATLAELDVFTETVRRIAGPSAKADEKLRALRKAIYESGPWNDHKPFTYDHADPFGSGNRNKLISHFLATRRGNCVSMPILFLIIADRLGLDMALALAPDHIFVRHREESGRIVNLETTSGAYPARNDWYRQHMPMSERALRSGIYLRSLSRREAVGVMASTVLEHLLDERSYSEAVKVSEVILRHCPRDVYTLLKQGTAFAHLIRVEFELKYPSPLLIPAPLRPRYLMLAKRNRAAFEAAEALGWEPVE